MPHSGGGSSHGGGGHSGGHGGGSHGGHGSPSSHTSRHYFSGARTYVYYRHGAPRYVYANYDMKGKQPIFMKIFLSLFFLPFFAVIILCTVLSCLPPKALKNTETNRISIDDRLEIFENTTDLMTNLTDFKEITGITPVIVTVSNSTWQAHYSSLERYAYNLYENTFYSDETYFLIVYSEPTPHPQDDFNDWHFELMLGDDTDGILTNSKADKFRELFDKNLLQSSLNSVEDALSVTFAEFNKTVMDNEIDPGLVAGMAVMFVIFLSIYIFVTFGNPFRKYKLKELEEVSVDENGKVQTQTCAYCKGVYVVDKNHTNCPHCGASEAKK